MRHHTNTRTLGRTTRQRAALLRGLAEALVEHEGITTTVAKAKELRPFVEKLVTASKKNSLHSRRFVEMRLGAKSEAVRKLHDVIGPRFSGRAGGYTRIVKLGRIGKRVADVARIEFVA